MSAMICSGETTNLILCLLVAVVAICHCTIAEEFDLPFPCQKNEQCATYNSALKNATCKNGYCVCENGSESKHCSSLNIPQHSSRNAVSSTIVNGCKVNQHCIPNSFCNTTISQCLCNKDYIMSTDKKQCLKKANAIDVPCVEEKQCSALLQNTTCRNGHCSCIDGYHHVGNTCYKTIELGKSCRNMEECTHIEGAICTNYGVCGCGPETMISNNKKTCLPIVAEILQSCVEDVQCSTTFTNAVCIDQICQCQPKFHFERQMNRCFEDKGLDEHCGSSFECYQIGDGNATAKAMQCTENICVCTDGFDRENDKCVNSEGVRFLGTLSAVLLSLFLYVVL
ncbi:uncharacterized protein LOC143189012 isoform X1 [Calliopsis andreniformis]|uniref:uncharacterized protein LOC143189012 isoform X1 n=1 Tax=Calliopsis andreniformis TaxID=337506 RepID=UPI003FCC60A5